MTLHPVQAEPIMLDMTNRLGLSNTYTFVTLEVPQSVYDFVAARLREASYGHAFGEGGIIDMHGIGLVVNPDLNEWHLNKDRTVAVSGQTAFMPMRNPDGTPNCPVGAKVQLLSPWRVATYGTWDGKNPWWCGWAPIPFIPDGLIPEPDYMKQVRLQREGNIDGTGQDSSDSLQDSGSQLPDDCARPDTDDLPGTD